MILIEYNPTQKKFHVDDMGHLLAKNIQEIVFRHNCLHWVPIWAGNASSGEIAEFIETIREAIAANEEAGEEKCQDTQEED